MPCDFCNLTALESRIAQENDLAYVIPTNAPIVPGHLLVLPKRHVQYYEELQAEEKNAIEALRVWAKEKLQKVFQAEGFNYAWNEEEIGGQSVPNFHLHVVPRKEGDAGVLTYEPREFLYRPRTRAKSPDEELEEVARELREG
jgi:diadenosine tetraphosphate (Ap4A) HIT family hydrolase